MKQSTPTSRLSQPSDSEEADTPGGRLNKVDRYRLTLLKLSLLITLVGVATIGDRRGGWPVISWPMYARLFEMPATPVWEYRLGVVTDDGPSRTFGMRELGAAGEHQIIEAMVVGAAAGNDAEHYEQYVAAITSLAHEAVPGQSPHAIEIWVYQWDADVMALPPLDRHRPDERRLISRIELNDADERGGAR